MHATILLILMLAILWLGRSIFIPFLIALFLWYMVNVIAEYFRKVMPYQNSQTFYGRALDWISRVLSIGAIGYIVYMFVAHISPMFSQLQNALPVLQTKLLAAINYMSTSFGFSFDTKILPNFTQIAASVGSSVASIAASVGMILVYLLFLFIEQETFRNKVKNLFANKRQSKKYAYIIESVDRNMKKYLFMKTIISGICRCMGVFDVHYELYSNNRFHCRMRFARIICTGGCPIDSVTNTNRDWFNRSGNIIRKYIGSETYRKNFELIHISNFNKLGILGYDMGCCRNVP